MNRKWAYKTTSLITGVIGLLALIAIGLIFKGGTPDPAGVIPAGIIAVIALPIAYITNRMGRR